MKRPGIRSRILIVLACAVAAAVAAPSASAGDLISIEQLATIGLSDFTERKVIEICLDYDKLKGGIAGDPEVILEVKVNRIEIPDLGLQATRGEWEIGPIKFEKPFDPFCISNLDVKIDVTNEEGAVDASALEEKLEQLEVSASGEPKEITPLDIDVDEGQDAEESLEAILANNGLLPEFTIQFTYTLRRVGGAELETKTVTFVNTNPRPIRVLRPVGPALRPALRFEIPRVPTGVAYLENEFWIEDADGNNVWEGYLEGGVAKVRYTAADYGRIVTHAYPSAAPDLLPGGSYRIVSKLRDPYGVEVNPSRLVGVRHDPEGESETYEIAMAPIELIGPVASEVDPSSVVFEWRDPNSADLRRGISRYRLSISGQAPVTVTGNRYVLRTPLLPDSEYTWEVEALDRFGSPVPGTRSETASFQTSSRQSSGAPDFRSDDEPQDRGSQSTSQDGQTSDRSLLRNQFLSGGTGTGGDSQTGQGSDPASVTTDQAPRVVGLVMQVFSGGHLLVADQELPEATGLALTGVVPAPYIVVGDRIVATGRSAGAAVALIQYVPQGSTAAQEIRLGPGTYVATPECLQTEDGTCL